MLSGDLQASSSEHADYLLSRLAELQLEENNQALLNITNEESVYYSHNAISEAKLVSRRIKTLCSIFMSALANPDLSNKISASSIAPLIKQIDEEFETHFEKLKQKIAPPSSKRKIAQFQQKQKNIEDSELLAYVKDVVWLLNYVDNKITLLLNHQQCIEISNAISTLFNEWLHELEVHELVPSTLHEFILTYTTQVGNLIAERCINCALQELRTTNNQAVAQEYFKKVLFLAHMNEQNVNELSSYYAKDREMEKVCVAMNFVWAQSFLGHYHQARENVEKIASSLDKLSFIIPGSTNVFVFYADRCALKVNPNLHEVLHWYTKVTQLYDNKEALATPLHPLSHKEKTLAKLMPKIERNFQKYLSEIRKIATPYHLQVGECTSSQLVFILPENISQKSFKSATRNLFSSLKTKQIDASMTKKGFKIAFDYHVPFYTIKKAIERIGTIVLRLDQSLKLPIVPQSAIPTVAAENLDDSSVEEMAKLQVEDTADVSAASTTCAEIPQGSTSARSPTSSTAENVVNVSINDETKSTAATDTYSASTSQPMTISPTIKLKNLFQHVLFQDALIKELNGAKGIFVAYSPRSSFKQPKKLDAKVEQRFIEMFDVPCKASAQNCNGFKWMSTANGPSLVGKLSRQSFRLFPVHKEISPSGETAFFYGEIKNSKKGKKSNRY